MADLHARTCITGTTGEILHDAANNTDTIIMHTFDLDDSQLKRDDGRVFIDRRPDLYKEILTMDGEN